MKCVKPSRIFKNLDPEKFPQGLEVPCGQCMPCRVARREEWALRLMHESLFWDSAMFFTLTYDEDHLPKNGTLVPNDLTKFFKRLRKAIGKRKVKYFACGDYGGKFDRPHYHVLMFGLDFLNELDRETVKSCWKKCNWDMLGKAPFGDVTPSSIRYVVRYIESKVIGKEANYAYDENDILPTYAVMSKGIGKDFAIKNNKQLVEDLKCNALGYTYSIPRYYRKITDIPVDDLRLHGRDNEIKKVKKLTGKELTRDEAYMNLAPDEVVKIEEAVKMSNCQNELNINARILLKERNKKR